MNIQNTQNRQKYWKMTIKENWRYFLISAEQSTLLISWLFSEVFCTDVYSISCKCD